MPATTATPSPPGSGSGRRRPLILAAGVLVAAAAVAVVISLRSCSPSHPARRAEPKINTGTFSQTNARYGTLSRDPSHPYAGAASTRATFSGGAVNGYERGIYNVRWEPGDTVRYGAAFFLPVGFRAKMQGEVDLMRWDNFPSHPDDTDWGGVVIFHGDRRARLMRFDKKGTGTTVLIGPFDVPEGRWFRLGVRQHLSAADGDASSVLHLDGRLVGRSTAANAYGRALERIRYGIVAIDAGRQQNPLTLWFARAHAADEPGR